MPIQIVSIVICWVQVGCNFNSCNRTRREQGWYGDIYRKVVGFEKLQIQRFDAL